MKKLFFLILIFPALSGAQTGWYGPSLSSMMASSFVYTSAASSLSQSGLEASKYKDRSADEKDVSLDVAVNQKDADGVAVQLAQAFPSENRLDAIKLDKELYKLYIKDGENLHTIAGAMAVFAVGSHAAFHHHIGSQDQLDANFMKVAKQFDAGIRKDARHIEKSSPEEIKSAYLQMVMLGMQLMAAVTMHEENGNADP